MYTITKTQTRPSVSVAFWTNQGIAAETFVHIGQNHQHNVLDSETTISEDGLTLTKTTVWASKEALDNFMSDPVVVNNLINKCHTYMKENNITYTTGFEEETP